jgi:hypothetical protein
MDTSCSEKPTLPFYLLHYSYYQRSTHHSINLGIKELEEAVKILEAVSHNRAEGSPHKRSKQSKIVFVTLIIELNEPPDLHTTNCNCPWPARTI